MRLWHFIRDNVPVDVHRGANVGMAHQFLLYDDRCAHSIQPTTVRVPHCMGAQYGWYGRSVWVLTVPIPEFSGLDDWIFASPAHIGRLPWSMDAVDDACQHCSVNHEWPIGVLSLRLAHALSHDAAPNVEPRIKPVHIRPLQRKTPADAQAETQTNECDGAES